MNKYFYFLLLLFIRSNFIYSQEIPANSEQQLENLAEQEEVETEDDSFLQAMQQLKKNPIKLNDADESDLRELRILTGLQIANLISYRKLLGKLISIYELQAVPGWDINTIHRIRPYIEVGPATAIKDDLGKRFSKGNHMLLLRVAQVWKKETNSSSTSNDYLGSPQRLFFRYRYSYKNLLQFGCTGDKDAGEQFFKGVQKFGFDFYSTHLFVRNVGRIKSLALGDFTVSLGQGLILWQSQAFKKSAETMGIKRQSSVLRPYNSAGEFFFSRGAGITFHQNHTDYTAFISRRKLGSNIVSFQNGLGYVSSFQTSGYHRNVLENEDRNNIVQLSGGTNIKYSRDRLQIGINAVYYQFSLPLQKKDEPYNYYSISGNRWYNVSADYSYTWRNIHFFGEAAIDKRSNRAFVNGLLISADRKIDLSFVFRSIGKAYQALNGNAFTENSTPTDEQGIYTGLSFKPTASIKLDAYADIFRFSWLKYRADAPGYGKDYLLQLSYTPNKQVEVYTRLKTETKTTNRNDSAALNYLVSIPKQNWRTQFNIKLNNVLTLRNRVEVIWFDRRSLAAEQGFLFFIDCLYKPALKPFAVTVRLGYFQTDGYSSRVYAYENDVLFSYSIPAFFDKGFRYYVTANYNVGEKISLWFRYGNTLYQHDKAKTFLSSEGMVISSTDMKLELIYKF